MKQLAMLLVFAAGITFAQEVTRHAGATDDFGAFVIGEIRNDTSEPLQYVQIVASFYDDGGNFIDSAFAYTERDVIEPDGESPFSIGTLDVDDFATYELQVQARSAPEAPSEQFSTSGVQLRQDDFGWMLVGQVTNETNRPMEYVEVVASGYAGARIVATGFAYTELDILQPGQTSPFRLSFSNVLDDISDYRLWVEGRPAD